MKGDSSPDLEFATVIPRTLLLSSSLPGSVGVGGIFLRDLCNFFPRDQLFAFVTASYGDKFTNTNLDGRFVYHLEPACDWQLPPNRFGRVGKFLHWGAKRVSNARLCNNLVEKAALLGSKHNVEQIWSVLESPTTIRITRKIAGKLGLPFKVMVWDDVDHVLPYFRVDRLTRKGLRSDFDWLLRNASSCAVIGEAMKSHYDQKYSTNAQIVRHGLQEADQVKDTSRQSDQISLHIGYAGSVTAKSAFSVLLSALEEADWSIDGRNVHLHLSGLRFVLGAGTAARIHYHGWLPSVGATVAMLNKCDLLYLPQPFEENLRVFTRLSFPAKLSTYLASERPIFLHGPRFGSLRPVFENYPFGCSLETLNTSDVIETITRFIRDEDAASRANQFGRLAQKEIVSLQQMRSAFSSFIGKDTRLPQGGRMLDE
ncbi:MAG: hypothetical protein KJN78_10875 [Gammaproteobacteria bacterium]|nr:hypothetical protein [Gammaproteobacteria bacterium]